MTTTTYVHLDTGETIVGEFDPPPTGALTPQARLHFGRIASGRVALMFDSLEQINQTLNELHALRSQWASWSHAQRMVELAAMREQAS
jgi:hypothetical protein